MKHKFTIVSHNPAHIRVRVASETSAGWVTNGLLTFAPGEWVSFSRPFRKNGAATRFEGGEDNAALPRMILETRG